MARSPYPSSEGSPRDFAGGDGRTRDAAQLRALCIGIDEYASSPLQCCVRDAEAWKELFTRKGFQVASLLNRQATYRAILSEIRRLVEGSSAGDVIAVQYSGHGTQLTRTSGDESTDEALVPFDYTAEGCMSDDELAAICDTIPQGVNVTFFMDCCHSGTITRKLGVMVGGPSGDVRERFLPADAAMQAMHEKKAANRMSSRGRPYDDRQEVLFSACRSTETAKESGGHGHFTKCAIDVFGASPGGMSNGDFVDRVRNAGRGTFHEQNPELWSDPSLHDKLLLGARGDGGGTSNGGGAGGTTNHSTQELLTQLGVIVEELKKNLGSN